MCLTLEAPCVLKGLDAHWASWLSWHLSAPEEGDQQRFWRMTKKYAETLCSHLEGGRMKVVSRPSARMQHQMLCVEQRLLAPRACSGRADALQQVRQASAPSLLWARWFSTLHTWPGGGVSAPEAAAFS